jgi:hypothetical protein
MTNLLKGTSLIFAFSGYKCVFFLIKRLFSHPNERGMISYPFIRQQFNLPYETIGPVSFHCLFKPTFVLLLHWTVPYLSPTYICVIKTNLMHYSSSVYFVNRPQRVSGIFVAHHQLKSTTRTNCCKYTIYRVMMTTNMTETYSG